MKNVEGYLVKPIYLNYISRLIKNIRVIYDANRPDGQTVIENIFSWAERIFFLGFGYAPENLAALDIPNRFEADQEVYGTAKGYYENEIDRVAHALYANSKLGSIFDLKIEDLGCLELLRKYLV